MTLDECTDVIRRKVGEDSGLGAVLKLDCAPDGVILLDATVVPNRITNEDRMADCVVGVALEDLAALLSGELDPTGAFLAGRLTVDGDMNVAVRLADLF